MSNSDIIVGLVQYEDTFQTILAFDKEQADKYSFGEILTRYFEDDMNIAEEIQSVILGSVDGLELMDMTLNEFILPDELQFDSDEEFKKYFEGLGFKTSQELNDFIANEYTSNQNEQLIFDDEDDKDGDGLPFDDWADSEQLDLDFGDDLDFKDDSDSDTFDL